MSDTRYGQISEGARKSTGHYELKKFWDMLMGLMPERKEGAVEAETEKPGRLAGEIADVRRMVTDPESTSTEWDNQFQDWMDTGEGMDEWSDDALISIYDELRDYEGQERYEMIEDLTKYRDRYYR